jgi:5-methyltetrahydrofolate corrinoid/iron sulfur protein methyltransferase
LILVADNLQVLNPAVAGALENLDPVPVQEIARRCEQAGAQVLDLNPGYLPPRREDRMAFLVETVQEVSGLRLMLDSPRAGVLSRGLGVCRRPPILNACTLEAVKLQEILPLAVTQGTDLVLLLLDERSFPAPTLDGKIALALELREQALAAGIAGSRLIFDPVVPNLSWPDAWEQVKAGVAAVRLLSAGALWSEPAATLAGLSNLRSGLRKTFPLKVEETALALLTGAGLTYALVDVLQPGLKETLKLLRRLS